MSLITQYALALYIDMHVYLMLKFIGINSSRHMVKQGIGHMYITAEPKSLLSFLLLIDAMDTQGTCGYTCNYLGPIIY